MEIQFTAPYLACPSASVMTKRPMAAAAMSQRTFRTRRRSRRKKPSTRNSTSPSKIAANCLIRLPGALEAVTARERVERKKAIVSISKPTHRVQRRITAYSHITAVSPRNATGTAGETASPPVAAKSWPQVSTWNTVSHKKEGHMDAGRSPRRFSSSSSRSATVCGKNTSGTPPSAIVSPSFTGADPSTALPFTAVPPLEPRS